MQTTQQLWPILVLLVGLAVGCSNDGYDLAPVSGRVTLDGEPLANASVIFQPMGGSTADPGPGSAGRTDAEGRFELATQTSPRQPGAVIGTHRVKIYSRSAETPSEVDVDLQPVVELVPMRYNSRSELTFPVPEEGSNEANFDLTTDEG